MQSSKVVLTFYTTLLDQETSLHSKILKLTGMDQYSRSDPLESPGQKLKSSIIICAVVCRSINSAEYQLLHEGQKVILYL